VSEEAIGQSHDGDITGGKKRSSVPLMIAEKQMMEIWTNHLENCITSRGRSRWLSATASEATMK
jgi:hypothetical protein